MDNLHQEMRQGFTDQNLKSDPDMLMTEVQTYQGLVERSVDPSKVTKSSWTTLATIFTILILILPSKT